MTNTEIHNTDPVSYEIELACDSHEGQQFAKWLMDQGHAVKIGKTTGSRLKSIEDPEEAEQELTRLWDCYCAS